MGRPSSKPLPTTMPTTTISVPSTTDISAPLDSCRYELQVILAFFSGGLLTLLIFILILCVTKLKAKAKGHPKVKTGPSERASSLDDHPMVSAEESITYASLAFDRDSSERRICPTCHTHATVYMKPI
ncbi:transmembrane protein C1orf162 homolog isoform X2 [Ascaphus truei]|uniref:transmembrane protein C1orf162 homolog isoform X2 n=1 Tax=Ascaphus truei TaxID=8439 RepID=UPI003F5A222A